MDKCIICGKETLNRTGIIDADDCGCYENGMVYKYVCLNCNADYCIFVPDTGERLTKWGDKDGTLF